MKYERREGEKIIKLPQKIGAFGLGENDPPIVAFVANKYETMLIYIYISIAEIKLFFCNLVIFIINFDYLK